MFGFLACVCLAAACSFDEHAVHCESDEQCAPGRCYKSFCIPVRQDTSSSAQTGSDAGPGKTSTGKGNQTAAGKGGSGGKPAAEADAGMKTGAAATGACKEGAEQPCLLDPKNTKAAETCNRGMQACEDGEWSACRGQPMPEPETCNGRDDDCNGEVDDLVEVCYPDGQTGCAKGSDGHWTCAGACGTGTRTCRDGKLSECEGATVPAKDECTPNGMVARNEDCDDLTDEGCDCRPGDTHACYSGSSNTMDVGKCKAGTQTCLNGAFSPCEGEVLDEPETCANPKVDDDCNGMVDDVPTVGNMCVVTTAQGPCRNGTLVCSATTGPSCVSTVTPGAEVCNGMDDDCNGSTDETFNLRRDAQNCGMCGHRCDAGESCCASRCVNSANDNNHCGACGMRCTNGLRCIAGKCVTPPVPMAGMPAGGAGSGGNAGSSGGAGASGASGGGGASGSQCDPACDIGLTCCNGVCMDLMNDPMNCMGCGTVCPFANAGCCAGRCVDFLDEKTCGSCTKDCSLLGDGSITCECKQDNMGKIGCTGPVLDLCL